MAWETVFESLRKMLLLEERVSNLNEQMRGLTHDVGDMKEKFGRDLTELRERLARLEGQFELAARTSAARIKRLPPSS